jgi:hypothetical protein
MTGWPAKSGGWKAARSHIRGPCVSLRIIGSGWVRYAEALSSTNPDIHRRAQPSDVW